MTRLTYWVLGVCVLIIGFHIWGTIDPTHENWGMHFFSFYDSIIGVIALGVIILISIPKIQCINALVASLKSESSQKNLALLGTKEREQVTEFLKKGQLPEKITDRFISALRDTLQGLEIVAFEGSDFLLALTRPGMPCTPEEFSVRYQKFLAEHMQGKDSSKVRIRVDW